MNLDGFYHLKYSVYCPDCNTLEISANLLFSLRQVFLVKHGNVN